MLDQRREPQAHSDSEAPATRRDLLRTQGRILELEQRIIRLEKLVPLKEGKGVGS